MRHLTHFLFALAIITFSSIVHRPSSLGAPAALTRLRIGITADGITRLTPLDLAAAGIDPATIDPRTFALSSLGRPVAIRVPGESDGHFDPGDALEFFGQRFRGPEMDQKYTDERVYWLDIGGAPGPRIDDLKAETEGDPALRSGQALTPPTDFPATLRAEQSNIWWTLHSLTLDTQDTWFWDRLQPIGAGKGITHTYPYPVPDPAPGFTATLRLEVVSRAWNDSLTPDHRTPIGLNGVLLADTTWDGKVRKVFTATVPMGLLATGANTVTVGALNPPGVVGDDVYVNYWELDYRRLFRAWQGQLDFRAENPGPHEYQVGGWVSDQVYVWDISEPDRPRQLVGASVVPRGRGEAGGKRVSSMNVRPLPPASPLLGTEIQIRFRVDDLTGAHYWLQADSTLTHPASLRLRPPTGLREPASGADSVIVTPINLRPAAERLADWHRAHGRRALVADLQDVYDEFNDGLLHPKAIPAMLAWATTHWPGPPPAYLTLVGDGHWNFKGFNPALYPPEPNPIPPYLAWADPWQGEVPADPLYGDLDGDGRPDLAVGRLAVNTLAEAQAVVDKIIAYDENTRVQPWQRRALFVADNPDDAGDFPALSNEIIQKTLPTDLIPLRVYLPGRPPALPATQAEIVAARAAISDALRSGVWLIQYSGHGALDRWATEQVWRATDISGLHNTPQLPVIMAFNCLDGYFAYPGHPSLAELMQRQPGGGSIAAISPSGLGLTGDQHTFRLLLMDTLFHAGVRELGQALLLAKQRFYAQRGSNYLIETMMFYGDPAMRMPRGLAWTYLPLVSHTP